MISGLSILFMAISAIISIGLPVVLFFVWRKKYNLKLIPMLVGVAAFVLFAMILEQLLHIVVLRPAADGTIALAKNNPALFVLYGIFAAGIFEETARFISFHLLKKKYDGVGTGLSYGIGHGGIEAVLIAGVAMLSSIVMSIAVNTGNAGILGSDPIVLAQIDAVRTAGPIMFLASGFERIIAITVHISLSVLVWCAVKVKGKLWLYPAAIILHAIVNIVPAMYQAGLTDNVWLVEAIIIIPATLTAIAAYFACKPLINPPETPPETPEDIS